MTDSQHNIQPKPTPFIPLSPASQGGHINVLYYDSSVDELDIIDCASCRLNAALGLSDLLKEWDNPQPL